MTVRANSQLEDCKQPSKMAKSAVTTFYWLVVYLMLKRGGNLWSLYGLNRKWCSQQENPTSHSFAYSAVSPIKHPIAPRATKH